MPTEIRFDCARCGKTHKESIRFDQIGNPVYDMQSKYGIVSVPFGELCSVCAEVYKKEKYRAEKIAESHINENFWRKPVG